MSVMFDVGYGLAKTEDNIELVKSLYHRSALPAAKNWISSLTSGRCALLEVCGL